MLKKISAVVAILMVASIGVAHAQDYPPATNSLTASDTTVDPGQQVTFTARTFRGPVRFTLFSDPVVLGDATANSSGIATLTAAIPTGTPAGLHRVDATGTGANGSPLTVSVNLMVSGGRDPLPKTGSSDTFPLATAGVVVLTVGGLLLLVARRRHSSSVAG